jgi:hypothetical protein
MRSSDAQAAPSKPMLEATVATSPSASETVRKTKSAAMNDRREKRNKRSDDAHFGSKGLIPLALQVRSSCPSMLCGAQESTRVGETVGRRAFRSGIDSNGGSATRTW